jgi:hypothetical protein
LWTRNPTWPDSGSNLCRRSWKLSTNLLSYSITFPVLLLLFSFPRFLPLLLTFIRLCSVVTFLSSLYSFVVLYFV